MQLLKSNLFPLQQLLFMPNQRAPIAFLDTVLDKVEVKSEVKNEDSLNRLDSKEGKMKKEIEKKLRVYNFI